MVMATPRKRVSVKLPGLAKTTDAPAADRRTSAPSSLILEDGSESVRRGSKEESFRRTSKEAITAQRSPKGDSPNLRPMRGKSKELPLESVVTPSMRSAEPRRGSKTPRLGSKQGSFFGESTAGLTPRRSSHDGPMTSLQPRRLPRTAGGGSISEAVRPSAISGADVEAAGRSMPTPPAGPGGEGPRRSSFFGSAEKPAEAKSQGLTVDFKALVGLSKKHSIDVNVIRNVLKDFQQLDVDDSGQLSMEEFKNAIRKQCGVSEYTTLPSYLLDEQWANADTDGDGSINFEEYLTWCVRHAWVEEMMVSDPKERQTRSIARRYGYDIDSVEQVKRVFDKFDENGNEEIDKHEFRRILIDLMKMPVDEMPKQRFQQFWLEVDTDHSGSISFEEFLVWYFNICNP